MLVEYHIAIIVNVKTFYVGIRYIKLYILILPLEQKHKLHASDIFNCKIEITYDRNDTF